MLKGFKIKDNKILCKCGHQIGIIDTKWQHIMKQEITISGHEHEEIKSTDSCYFCKCNNPEPVKEDEKDTRQWLVLNNKYVQYELPLILSDGTGVIEIKIFPVIINEIPQLEIYINKKYDISLTSQGTIIIKEKWKKVGDDIK